MPYDKEPSKSSLLVQYIGIPGVCNSDISQLNITNVPGFLQKAKQNKIPLLFLRTVASLLDGYPLQSTLLRYEEQYQRTLDLTKFVAALLENCETPYTLFKTVKPFPYVPSDIDVLLLSNNDLEKVINTLKGKNCIVLDRDNYGVTMFSLAHRMCIDLTTQVAVSGIIYVNKKVLFDHVSELDFSGTMVRILEPHAELLTVTAHSIFKEQMYTLNDYYAIVMLTQHWEEASKLAEKLHLKHALETVLKMTRTITVNAFGSLNPLMEGFETLGITSAAASSGKDIELPKKYELAPIIVEFLKKFATDRLALNSLSSVTRSLCSPEFYRRIVNHATREKY